MRFMLNRRGFLGTCGLAAASRLLPACSRDETSVAPDGPVEDRGDFVVPPLLEGEMVDGVRVIRLQLQTGQMEWVTGAPTATYGINGNYLGPTLHMQRGDRVRIEVTNSLGETSTLHWHGMQVPSRADGGPYQTIAAGTTWVAEYTVDQRAATTWYHPHQMHETARQVYMGMGGVILVEDGAIAGLPGSYGVDDLPVVIQDRRLFADGTHPYSPGKTLTMHDMMSGVRGDTMLINGVKTPRRVVPRGLVRLRLLNGSNARIYNVGLSDNRSFLHIASDGGLLEAPLTTTRVLIAPGERAEILVDFSADETGTRVRMQSFSGEVFDALYTGQMGANLTDALDRTTFDLMTFEAGSEVGATMAAPTSFAPIVKTLATDAVRTRPIAFAMAMGRFTINGVTMTAIGSAIPAAINFQIKNGETEIWTATNTSGVAHPLHLHHRHFQILDIDGAPPPPELAGWKDTTIIAPGRTVRLIVTFDGTPDAELPYMFHCHLLEHEDMGMMGQFYIVP